jgi:futalosine hydrolase
MKRILVIVAVGAERAALGARCLAAPEVHVVVAGIGRTNAAAATAEALTDARAAGAPFAAVISTGIAGALPGSNIALGTVIVADACIYAEEGIALPEGQGDMRVLGFPLGDFEGNRVPVDGALLVAFRALGPACAIATVATCSGTDAAALSVRTRTGAMAEAMEGAAVVHAARRVGVPALEIRSISNTTGDRATQRWDIAAAFTALQRVGDALVNFAR